MARISDYSGGKSTTAKPQSTVTIDPYYQRDPKTGLSPAQVEATAAQTAAQKQATTLATAVGAKIDPTTGLIQPETMTNPQGVYTFAGAKPISKPTAKKIVGYIIYKDPTSGAQYGVPRYDDGTDGFSDRNSWVLNYGKQDSNGSYTSDDGQKKKYVASDGKEFTDQQAYVAYETKLRDQKLAQESANAAAKAGRQSAYDMLYEQFNAYGLGSLITPLKDLIEQNVSPSEFTLRLRQTDAYKKRFAANASRIAKGLAALSEADYINLEDRYQRVMRQYGLPESYYAKGELGAQPGFEKLIAADVRDDELADRLGTAYNRVINAAPEITTALKRFYPDITNGDILAYVLDPQKGLLEINRKVTAAEIGGAALGAGLATNMARAEELGRYGVTGQQAQQGYQSIGGYLPRASQLGDIYAKQGMGPFTQATAEAEVFGLPSAVEAATKRRKLSELEAASFSGQAGVGALARERAGQF